MKLTPQLQQSLVASVDILIHFHEAVIGLHLCRDFAFN